MRTKPGEPSYTEAFNRKEAYAIVTAVFTWKQGDRPV